MSEVHAMLVRRQNGITQVLIKRNPKDWWRQVFRTNADTIDRLIDWESIDESPVVNADFESPWEEKRKK